MLRPIEIAPVQIKAKRGLGDKLTGLLTAGAGLVSTAASAGVLGGAGAAPAAGAAGGAAGGAAAGLGAGSDPSGIKAGGQAYGSLAGAQGAVGNFAGSVSDILGAKDPNNISKVSDVAATPVKAANTAVLNLIDKPQEAKTIEPVKIPLIQKTEQRLMQQPLSLPEMRSTIQDSLMALSQMPDDFRSQFSKHLLQAYTMNEQEMKRRGIG